MNKSASFQQFVCDDYFSFMNTTFAGFNCAALINHPTSSTCQNECDKLKAKRADYDNLLKFNATKQLTVCGGGLAEDCEIEVDIDYNFDNRHWESNGQRLDNLTWQSRSYPQLRDLITVCGFSPLVNYHAYNLRYCTKSSSSLDWKRMDFVNSQFTDMTLEQRLNQRFYFCANDLINVSNLKQGTLTHAQNDCSRSQIMAPDICHNTTITDTIIDVVREARIRFNIGNEVSQMWTGIKRHNATHFSNGNKWFVGTDLGLAIFLYNQQFLIEHLLEDASKSMSNTNV